MQRAEHTSFFLNIVLYKIRTSSKIIKILIRWGKGGGGENEKSYNNFDKSLLISYFHFNFLHFPKKEGEGLLDTSIYYL